ncbi:MAG: VOC family protein [Cytophagales bacterium]|nr:VOC family protein [Cytophagales bacterium]
MISPFHLAFPVKDLDVTRKFYQELIGCKIGRTSDRWIDFDFFGNQVTAHLKPEELQKPATNPVDGKEVPVRHFGAILEWQQWHNMADRLKEKKISFVIEPYIRFKGQPGEQATMFFYDPSGNALEFKSFKDKSRIFAT